MRRGWLRTATWAGVVLLVACAPEQEVWSPEGAPEDVVVQADTVTATADLAVTITDNRNVVGWTHVTSYTIEVINAGPDPVSGATVATGYPPLFTGPAWTCVGIGGGSCATASGTGPVAATVDLPVGGGAVITQTATLINGVTHMPLEVEATVTVPTGVLDPDTANNTAIDHTEVGQPRTITLQKRGSGLGTVVSHPAGIDCGPTCTGVVGDFVQGQVVTFTATPEPFHVFVRWGGSCTGSGSCTVTVAGNSVNLEAYFEPIRYTITTTAGPGGAIVPPGPVEVPHGGSQLFQIAPAVGYHVDDVRVDGTSLGVVTEYEFTNVTAPHTLEATFALNLYPITVIAGPNGTVVCDSPVAHFATAICTVTPDSGYTLDTFLDNGANAFAAVVGGSYTTPPVEGPRTIEATFKLDLGAECTTGSACHSGFCVDGVCCESACTGQCEACDGAGAEGTCAPVAGAPHGDRPACASDGSLCGGACDGIVTTACTYPDNTIVCRGAACTDGTAILAETCGGDGTCPPVRTQDCAPYLCGETACEADCTVDADCTEDHWCAGGICVPDLPPGETCGGDQECATGHCVDGVCCDTACTGQCEACDVAGAEGTCTPVDGPPHGGRPACAADGTVCGGTCVGAVSTTECVYPGEETSCREGSCAEGVATLPETCDGAGTCPPERTQDCGEYVCGPTACRGDCAADVDCSDGFWCNLGVCVPELQPGQACTGENECASGFCVDGVCCDTACDGQCEACDVSGSVGTCSPVTGAPRGTRSDCASDGTVCGGTCDGVERASCTYPGNTTSCREPSCTDGVATLEAFCNGAGSCPAVQTQECGTYGCDATACHGDCDSDADCAPGAWCSGGLCLGKRDLGVECGGNNECLSGLCVDGFCCNLGCDGQCEACDVAGSEGTCVAVTGAPHGGRTPCTSDGGVCGGACNGDDRTACAYPGEETVCREASCADGRAVEEATCNGRGSCPAPESTLCDPYLCGEDACAETCEEDDECAPGHRCIKGSCLGPDQIAQLLGNYAVEGGGGCSAGAGGAGWLALLAVLGGFLVRRRRGALGALGVALALGTPAAGAAAKDDTAIEVQRFQPSGGGRDILGVGSALTPGHLQWGLHVFGNHASKPLRLVDRSGEVGDVDLLTHQTGVDFTGFVGILDRYELSFALPVAVSQDTTETGGILPTSDASFSAGGFSSLRLIPKARILSLGDLHLAAAAPVVIPLGSGAPYLDPGGPSVHPRAIAEWNPGFRVAANLGVAVREKRDLADLALGPAFTFGLAGEVPVEVAGLRFDALGTLLGETGFRESDAAETPLELLVGGRWNGPAGLNFTLAAGPGLTTGYGTPAYRVVAGFGFGPEAAPAELPPPTPVVPPIVEAPPPPPPEPEPVPPPDTDGDGYADAEDGCPKLAEDFDGDADEDGCPEEEQVVVEKERIVIKEAVHFAVAKADILETSHELLEQVAKVLRENPTVKIRVEGHTDSTGLDDFNRTLSERRAEAVRKFLVAAGVEEERLVSQGYGPDRPVDTNATPEGRSKNRRVDFVILEQ
jgi:MYXO-CTERM domain-containing protein